MRTGNSPKELGLRIRTARLAKELTQEDLGKLVGLSRTSIVNIERGKQSPPIHKMIAICKKLNKPFSFFIRLEDVNDETYPDYELPRKLHDEIDKIPAADVRMFASFHKRITKSITETKTE
jgi:putative transcriptional regulator